MATAFTYAALYQPTLTYQTKVIVSSGYQQATYDYSYTATKRNQHIGWRDKNRYVFAAQNGYMPQYPYAAAGYDASQIAPFTYRITEKANPANWHFGRVFAQCEPSTLGCETSSSPRVTSARESQIALHATKINGKAREQYYSLFETLYEGRKTKKMFASTARTIAGAMRDVRRFNFSKAAQKLGLKKVPKGVNKHASVSDNWLAFRYGWTPLYYSLYGEMKRQYDRMKGREPVRRISYVSGEELPLSNVLDQGIQSVDNHTGLVLGGLLLQRRTKVSTTVKMKSVYYYTCHNPSLSSATELGLTNPLLIAWELLPLSFVADWFINISDVLAQFDAWQGKQVVASSRAFFVDSYCAGSADIVGYPNPSAYTWAIVNPSTISSRRRWEVIREVGLSPPTVLPKLQFELNPKRTVDAIALLVQGFKRR